MSERARIFSVLGLVALATLLVWFSFDRELRVPDWTGQVRGLSYNPSNLYSEAQAKAVTPEQIQTDLKQLSAVAERVRTYSVSRGLDAVPEAAARLGMKVSLGIWLSANRDANEDEISLALRTIRKSPAVFDRIFVGNEAVLRGDLSAAEVSSYIRRVKRSLPRRIPVATAEPWHVWRSHPELAEASDFIGAHFLPFWEGVEVEEAMRDVRRAFFETQIMFWRKPLVIAEVGWPSEGRSLRNAVASPAAQALFVRRFLVEAKKRNWDYYLIEAYDQPWKVALEGSVGAYWGAYTANGTPKFDLTGPISLLPDWPSLALTAIVLTLLAGFLLLRRMSALSFRGLIFLAAGLGALISGGVAIYHDAALTYATWFTWLVFAIILPVGVFAAAVMLTEGIEMAHALFRHRRRPILAANDGREPFVSIHVPAYNEPADMMIETLNALSRLDYGNYEVIVLDNNTRDPKVWAPVEAHCRELGQRFRFYHFDGVKGFKAGALNIAMEMTHPDAEIIAVIDSDYQVAPDWLSVATPYFTDPAVAIVQAPQDYRDAGETAFKRMAYEEYAGFFRIGMVERNEDNAIIQHGTMTMMRASAMREAGGWAPWCITEDTELGLRIFEKGWKAVYLDRSLGRGLMPDTFGDYKGQRHRWVYGAMQILKRHAGAFAGEGTALTAAQKYHFIAGWLPWLSDALSLVFVVCALLWTGLMIAFPMTFDAPMASLGMVAIALFAVKVGKTLWLYPARVGTGMRGAASASIAGLALSHTVARAVLSGLVTSQKPFFRTPKLADAALVRQVIAVSREELALFVGLGAAIVAMFAADRVNDPAGMVWVTMLAIQALPYAATLAVAALSLSKPKMLAQTKPEPAPVPTLPTATVGGQIAA